MNAQKQVSDIAPLDYAEVMVLATEEWRHVLALVDGLTPAEWEQQTDCVGWDVRAVLGHLLGMLRGQADPEYRARQIKEASVIAERDGVLRIDALTALQVAEAAGLSTDEFVSELHVAAPRGLAARKALPAEVRETPYDPELPGEGIWTLGHLLGVIHTRDPWLHRVDICRAIGRPLELSAEHDGRIVENVVAEWAAKHGQPFDLTLTGTAGGRYVQGEAGQVLALDAIEFCRVLSGRAPGSGLLGTRVVF